MEKVYLRAIESSDYETTFKWRNNDEIASMVGGQKYFVSIEKEKKWVEEAAADKSSVRLLICLTESQQPIGMVALTNINYVNRSAHSHILLGDKSVWGKGYGTAALRQLLDYAFEEMGLNRIEALILASNIGSLKIHQRCGYVEEGVKREAVFKNGKFHNQILVAVLRSDIMSKDDENK